MTNLLSFCESLQTKSNDLNLFIRTLLDFFVIITDEKVDVCKIARDPVLPRFFELSFIPFLNLTSSSDPSFLQSLKEITRFFKQLFISHPFFLDSAAITCQLDTILTSLVPHRENQLIRPICECLALISQTSQAIVRTATSA
jgi:hypothetical protein